MRIDIIRLRPSLLLLFAMCLGSAAVDEELIERDAVISLTEDELSGAFSFTEESDQLLPNFEQLDRIYPDWHKGDPAAGRRAWLAQRYRMHLVEYRADMVNLQDEFTATVRGKKLVAWTTDRKSPLLKNIWPFQLWKQIKACKESVTPCKYVVYSIDYELEMEKVEEVGWIVAKEKTSEMPDGAGDKVSCTFANALGDWRASGTDWSFGRRGDKCPKTAEPALQERQEDTGPSDSDEGGTPAEDDGEGEEICTDDCD